jgi:hypothetical protein
MCDVNGPEFFQNVLLICVYQLSPLAYPYPQGLHPDFLHVVSRIRNGIVSQCATLHNTDKKLVTDMLLDPVGVLWGQVF